MKTDMETDIEDMQQPQAQACLGLPEAENTSKAPSLQITERARLPLMSVC